ncbi:hypothetical protein [Candidatus Leptofilum sp.]|uniref:hypothetical protein n=1 Tax=Candidatus Leptofilum sp. TaxID=3241576 RepID=UPI003B5C023F
MKLEYLIIVKQADTFCNSKKAFLNFLGVDSSIKISGKNIRFHNLQKNFVINAELYVTTGLIPAKKERYFHLTLVSDQENVEQEFTDLALTLKSIASKIKPGLTRIDTLWNDVGRNYAIQAYPLIYEIENLMRKLISKFMLINVGMDWSQETIHSDILAKIENRHGKQNSYLDILHKTDFIHLSDVLFRKYRTLALNDLDRILQKEESSTETFEKIKKILPKSNWERHFSKIIDYEEEKLKTKWQLLYELRNDIAHNRYIDHSDFAKIKGLATEIKQVLIETINKLDKIDLTADEKENIISSYEPNSLSAQNILAESSVTDWYINNYEPVSLEPSSHPMDHFDLLIESDASKIAVEIKHVFPKQVNKMLNLIRNRYIGRANKMLNESVVSEFHVVLVIRNLEFINEENTKNILWHIADLQRTVNSQIKIIPGFINDENRFTPLQY